MKHNLRARALYWASFNRFELRLPGEAVGDCSHSGQCDADVARWAPRITRPARCTVDALREELAEYGAWDAEELADDAANWRRIVWIAAGNISEEESLDCSRPVGRIERFDPDALTERELRGAGLHPSQV